MVISRKKQFNYVLNIDYPIIGNKVQKDLDDTDSITFSRFVSKKAVVMCANRLEYILANNPDNFDLDVELSNWRPSFVKGYASYTEVGNPQDAK